MGRKIELSEKKEKEILEFLRIRFKALQELRDPLDTEIKEEVEIYNNIDKELESKPEWVEKYKVPYVYTIVQTMVARLIETLFGQQNYVRVYVEDEKFTKIERDLRNWIQEELDKIKFSARARDFLETSLVERTAWLQLYPVYEKGKLKKIDFNVISFFDIWFDTKYEDIEKTDVFIRKIVKYYWLKQNTKIYKDVDKIQDTTPPDFIKEKQVYKAKHGVTYYDPNKNNTTDEVELLEWYGIYDISEDPENPNFQPVIFTLANRSILIRAEINDLPLERKKLLFPIRPLRQAKSLIGKSVPQIVKDLQHELNVVRSLRMQNFKLLVKLLFKYKKDAGIDFDELFAEGGNAIGYTESPHDIDIFPIQNHIPTASYMATEIIQDMQQVTGAVDYVMGTSAGRGITETASGIRFITEQALFKFSMMAKNIYNDILDFINYLILLLIIYGKSEILLRHPELKDFFDLGVENIENSYVIDIALSDLALRRDIERSQFINAINIIAGLLQQAGGNIKALLRVVMERFDMQNIDEILSPPPEAKMAQMLQLMQMAQSLQGEQGESQKEGQEGEETKAEKEANQKRGGSIKANPQAEKEAMPEEEAYGVNPKKV